MPEVEKQLEVSSNDKARKDVDQLSTPVAEKLRAKVLAPLKEISRDDLIKAITARAMQTAKAAKETGETVIKANMPDRRPRWKKFVRNHPAIVAVTSLMTIIKIYRARKPRT